MRGYRYFLKCTECRRTFPPEYYGDQWLEFRMCEHCQKCNPEIVYYLEKYVYEPHRDRNWRSFQERLDDLQRQYAALIEELNAYKRQYDGI